jgi:Tol biopolymer transport system component
VHPSISDDGTRVAFETASAIGSTYVVFLYNMTNNTTTVVWTNATANPFGSAAIISGDDAYGPEITPDGRFILFSGLEASTTNASVRLWDAETGTNVLVSANTNGVFSTGSTALAAAMTPDAHYVTFLSDAADLTTNALYPGAPTNQFHIFRRDTVGGGIVMVDADTNGFGENNFYGVDPVMSTNGQFVFFSGPDAGLVPGDVNGAEDVFLWDASTGLPQVLSEANPLLPVRAGSGTSGEDTLFVSGDGRWVAFSSVATNLVPDDTNNAEDVFVCDRWSGTNILVSVAVNGGPALGGASFMPTISTNGRYVAFVSYATNLTPDPIAGAGTNANVFRRDLQTQTTVLVSVNTNGTSSGNWSSASSQAELALSPDGRYVAFYSGASDLAATATTGGVFLRDIDGGNTVAIATNTGAAFFPITMSTNSRYVAYSSSPRSGVFQTGVWDRNYGTNIFTNAAFFASISPDGSHLLDRYISTVTVWDLVHGTNMLTVTGAERIYTPQVWSGDGRYVVIGTSAAYSGVDLNHAYDIYLFDLLTGTNMLVSVNSTHTGSGSAYSDWPAISGNGRFVVYRSFATNLVAGHTIFPDLYVFDSNTGSNSVLAARQLTSDIINWPLEPVISMDGSTAIFQSTGCGFGLGSLNGVQNVFAALLPSAETADSDGDGIPDWWMIQYFGHVTGQAFDQSLATDDPNGTGMAVLQDYIAGTIPTDPTSVFQLQVPPPAAPSGGLTLTWGAVVGRTYSVQYKNTLDDPAWQPLTGSPVINGNQGQMAVPTDQSTRYFRIVVQ